MDDVLDGSDVVLGVGGEGGQGGEDFCGLGDAFLYGGADEIDEGLFGVLSVEFFVLSGESFEEVEGKVGDAICGGFWGGVEGGKVTVKCRIRIWVLIVRIGRCSFCR